MATHAARIPSSAAPAADPAPPVSRLDSTLLLLRFATVMALVLGAAALPRSALFTVRRIRVEGAVRTPAAALIARAGLRAGDRLFTVPAGAVASRVAADPRIARAAVRIRPPGEVVVRVVEREAYAAVPYRGRYLVLDRDGIVFETRPAPGALPILTTPGFAPAWVRLGDRLPSGALESARQALPQLPPAVITPGTRLRAEPGGDLVLMTADRITVRLGPLRGLLERAALLGELLDAVRARGLAVEYLDLRFAGNVVMRPAGAADRAGEAP